MIIAEVEVTGTSEVLGHSSGSTFTGEFDEGFLQRKTTAGALKIIKRLDGDTPDENLDAKSGTSTDDAEENNPPVPPGPNGEGDGKKGGK